MHYTKIYLEFIITGFEITCNELTTIIDLSPTRYFQKGESYELKYNKKVITLGINEWILDSGISPDNGLDEIFRGMLNKLRPFKNNLIPICKKYSTDFNIIIHIYGNDYPGIIWENDILKEIAEYNASMGIDLSVFPEDIGEIDF